MMRVVRSLAVDGELKVAVYDSHKPSWMPTNAVTMFFRMADGTAWWLCRWEKQRRRRHDRSATRARPSRPRRVACVAPGEQTCLDCGEIDD